jgi:predicted Rossmann fold nucleotide-binding protein DprA/Smf involved in DNA uptake
LSDPENWIKLGKNVPPLFGNAFGISGMVLYSGGARGVDTISLNAALDARGSGACILADSLEKSVRNPHFRTYIDNGDLCLVTPYSPEAGFSVGAAMGRNRLIYCLADFAIVVSSDVEKGGTWAGASEALKSGWVPVFVLDHAAMPEGNRRLISKGAIAFPHPFPEHFSLLPAWLKDHSARSSSEPSQLGLL